MLRNRICNEKNCNTDYWSRLTKYSITMTVFFKSQIVKKSRQLQKQNKYFKSFNTIYALKWICFEKLSSL